MRTNRIGNRFIDQVDCVIRPSAFQSLLFVPAYAYDVAERGQEELSEGNGLVRPPLPLKGASHDRH